MLLTVFENHIFLQSLGWGIANSLWQVALLFLFYQTVTATGKRFSALSKYHLSLLLVFASFAWFVSTVVQNYLALKQAGPQVTLFTWLNVPQHFSQSLQWLAIAYVALLSVHLLFFAKKIRCLFSFNKKGLIKAPVHIRLFTEQTAFHLGIHKKISIWLCDKVSVPSVIGFFKPMILFPVSALNNLTTSQAEAVILHELAHIRRNDYVINFLQCCIELILFFNPFIKLLGAAARKERENCCDDWVVNYQYNRHDYAAALVILENNRFATVQFALAATNGKKNLLQRVRRLFAEEHHVSFTTRQKIKLFSVAFAIVMTILFALPVSKKGTVATVSSIQNALKTNRSIKNNIAIESNLPQVIVVEGTPAKIVKQKADVSFKKQKTAPVNTNHAQDEVEYKTALVNEELLQQPDEIEMQQVALHETAKERENEKKLWVKVEEEQSGSKDKCTYFVEVNNINGVPEIKPLIVLNTKVKKNDPPKTGKSKTKARQKNWKKRNSV